MTLTPDGNRAVSAGFDGTLRVWDVQSGECLRILEGHTERVNSVALTPDGNRAVSATSSGLNKAGSIEASKELMVLSSRWTGLPV